jgi:hypothetical protein
MTLTDEQKQAFTEAVDALVDLTQSTRHRVLLLMEKILSTFPYAENDVPFDRPEQLQSDTQLWHAILCWALERSRIAAKEASVSEMLVKELESLGRKLAEKTPSPTEAEIREILSSSFRKTLQDRGRYA